jgi:predicted GNAT family N-acyltransferase
LRRQRGRHSVCESGLRARLWLLAPWSLSNRLFEIDQGVYRGHSAFAKLHIIALRESYTRSAFKRFRGYFQKRLSRMIVRIANTYEDIEACFQIRDEVFVIEQNVPVTRERDEHDSTAIHFLVLDDGKPVGTARVVLTDKAATAKIGRVAVIASMRGNGIGKILMKAIEENLRLRHVTRFALDAQTHALQFYERLGYDAYGDEFMDAGIPHRHMTKKNETRSRPS